ncbi:MAG: glycosyltransferase [Clostridia bacterium]|nr:glycosyltransferase [Clostridia bacterium]
MKIIILSASTGGGHMSAANCVKEYLNENGDSATVIDTLEYISPLLNKTVVEVYEHLAKKHPTIWKLMYTTTNKKSLNKIVEIINKTISKKLIPLLAEEKPDLIISTHPFSTEMISHLKKNENLNIPLICIMTDYAPHRTWLSPNVDSYVVANEEMIEPMEEMGVEKNKIHPFGIPVDNDFFNFVNKKEELRNLGLRDDLPTILIMAGNFGLANIGKVFVKLQKVDLDFQIIIITGKNKGLFNDLKQLTHGKRLRKRDKILAKMHLKNISEKHLKIMAVKKSDEFKITKPTKLIYYTNEVDKYMHVSDLIITKPGGLTISEALACNLPMALFGTIPGQEEENANFLVGKNMAVKLENASGEENIIRNLLLNPEKLNFMKYNCKNFDKSDCLKNIFNLIHSMKK